MSPAEQWDVRTSSASGAYDAWSRMLSATHLPWSITELSPDPSCGFAASVRRRQLADLVLVECTCSPNGGVRRRHEIAATDDEYLVMLMTLAGHEMVSQGGQLAQLSPGSVVVWDSEHGTSASTPATWPTPRTPDRPWHAHTSTWRGRSSSLPLPGESLVATAQS